MWNPLRGCVPDCRSVVGQNLAAGVAEADDVDGGTGEPQQYEPGAAGADVVAVDADAAAVDDDVVYSVADVGDEADRRLLVWAEVVDLIVAEGLV